MFGGMLGSAWNLLWPGSPSGAFAMVGAAAMIGASMQAPLTALSLILELTHSGFGLLVPMLAATVTATAMARYRRRLLDLLGPPHRGLRVGRTRRRHGPLGTTC